MVKPKKNIGGVYLCDYFHTEIRSFLKMSGGDYLEIGIYCGKFFAELSIEFPLKNIVGIDPFISDGHTSQPKGTLLTDIENIFSENIIGLNNVQFFKGTTKDYLDAGTFDEIQNVSCVLIDGSHHYDDILFDIELVEKIKNDHVKLIIFDDINIPDVAKAISLFKTKFQNRIISCDHEFKFPKCDNYDRFYFV